MGEITVTIPLNFDSVTHSPDLAREAKDSGQGRAILPDGRAEVLELARAYARCYARIHKTVSSDDVRKYFTEIYPDKLKDYTKVAGSVFRSKVEWEFVSYQPSGFVSRHGNRNGVWRLK